MFKCACGKKLEIMKSGAGWYIGTTEFDIEFETNFPNCRCSNYYESYEDAKNALEKGFTFRLCAENEFCAESHGAESCAFFRIIEE